MEHDRVIPEDGQHDTAFGAFQPFLDQLPIAAGIAAIADGEVRIVAANRRYASVATVHVTRRLPVSTDGRSIVQAIAALLEDPDAAVPPAGFEWREGDTVGGRYFRVHLARMKIPAGGPAACLVSLLDRTVEIESARSLRAELLQDSLTGLPNRIAFTEAVDQLVAGPGSGGHAVLLVDLARFSRVNESLGAMAGDEVIITVARRLISTLRAGDLLARVGGDEFGVLLRAGGQKEVAAASKRIQAVLANPFRLAEFEIGLECAIGCALDGSEHTSGEELVRAAQLALKRAKETGRIESHSSGEAARARTKLNVETELRRAIANDTLTLAFQPIVDLAADEVVGFEALSRWHHPVRGAIDPSEFIPVAEEAGLIVPLGRWAIERALTTLAAWDRTAGKIVPVSISVNVSAIQLARDDVPAMIGDALSAHGIAGDRLIVELTESAIVLDPERTARALNALKSLNVRVAMDDFGTGYSSLTQLRRLPIDILKIDRSFVSGMLADRDKLAIVRAVLSLADALGKQTTAEGVETTEISQTLAALGCTRGQGYFYAMPLGADDALAYWRARSA